MYKLAACVGSNLATHAPELRYGLTDDIWMASCFVCGREAITIRSESAGYGAPYRRLVPHYYHIDEEMLERLMKAKLEADEMTRTHISKIGHFL
jgi:hypothetical protein